MSDILKGVRYQKRISLGKFFRLNISKSGIGLSIGVDGLRYSRGPSGSFFTIGLPGTGLRYQKKVSKNKGFQFSSLTKLMGGGEKEAEESTQQTMPDIPKPGFFSSGWEKGLYRAVEAYHEGDIETAVETLEDVADDRKADPATILLLAFLLSKSGNQQKRLNALNLLETVISTDDTFPTEPMETYLQGIDVDIDITPQVEVTLPITDGLAAPLQLVELYQDEDQLEQAIDLLEAIDDLVREDNGGTQNEVIVLSLFELYLITKNPQFIMDKVRPPEAAEDDVKLGILFFYGRALQEKNLHDGAIQVFNKCLRRRKGLNPALLGGCRLWRALSFIKTNQKSRGRKELERVLVEATTDELKTATNQALALFWPDDFQQALPRG